MPNTREKLIELFEQEYNRCEDTLCSDCKYDADKDCGLHALVDHLIANGVTIQKWIPVNEPPMKHGCYLVTVKHWFDRKPVVREAYHNGSCWVSCERRIDISHRVTNWKPLPQPPKGE